MAMLGESFQESGDSWTESYNKTRTIFELQDKIEHLRKENSALRSVIIDLMLKAKENHVAI